MKKNNIKTDVIMIIIISFIGYWFEDIWMVIRHGVLDNRNMYLPFLLGYGLFILALYYIVGSPKKIFNKLELKTPVSLLVYFLICFILVSVGELLLGLFVEKTGGYSYWDYSSIPLHITKYTSVPTSCGFALVITLFMNYIFVPLRNKISNIVNKIPTSIVIILLLALVIDFFVSFRNMYTNNGKNTLWQIFFR